MDIICKPGDILILHNQSSSPTSTLIGHAGVVCKSSPALMMIDLVGDGMWRQSVISFSSYGTAFRLSAETAETEEIAAHYAYEAVVTANYWILQQGFYFRSNRDIDEEEIGTPHSPYSISSIFSSLFGSSVFGPTARAYADYLHENCQKHPPKELCENNKSFFCGTICSYIPVAIYQTVLGPFLTPYLMALDARRVMPKTLAWYLDQNVHWQTIGPGYFKSDDENIIYTAEEATETL